MEHPQPFGSQDIQELVEVPGEDWHELFAGNSDPFDIEHLGLAWRHKDTHFVLYREGRAVSHVSILLRHTVRVGREHIAVTGVAGVITRRDLRRRGLAAWLLSHGLAETRERARSSFAFLFCLPRLVPLYDSLGWNDVRASVHIKQPSGVIEAPLPAMVLPIQGDAWPAGPVWLDSAPW